MKGLDRVDLDNIYLTVGRDWDQLAHPQNKIMHIYIGDVDEFHGSVCSESLEFIAMNGCRI